MKPVIPIILLVLLSTKITFGQVKIGDNPQNIDPSSVLELESSSRVLVITRVSSQEMEAISPQRGGVVYNTDTECMHYYNGINWINLCDATSFSLTNDPIENSNRTISLVDNGTTINLEVALNSIRSENIVDGGINGDDIQDNSIGESKLGADSVGRDELRDNAVGSAQIIDGSITPGDMANTIPNQVLTTDINGAVIWEDSSNLRGAVADEVSITGGGTTANPLRLADVITDNIAANTTAITAHVSADGDTDNQNEVLTNAVLDGNELVLTESGVERRVDLGALNNAGTDNQTLNLTNGNILEIDGGNTVDLSNFLDNTDAQELELDGNTIRISGGNEITLPAGAVDTDDQDLTLAGTTLNITDGLGVDLNPLLVGAADGVVTGVALNGTSLDFTGADGGFNGSVSLATLGGGAGSTEVADQITITGIGTIADPFKIQPLVPAPATEQMLITNIAGDITWSPVGSGGGSTELADQVTIIGDGQTGTEFAVADSGITPIKIEPSATPGQFLSTDTGGNVVWDDLPIAGGVTATDVTFTPYTTLPGPNTQLAIEQLKDELDAATIAGGGENPTNELQDIQLAGTVLSLTTPATAGNSIDLDTNFATDAEVTAAITASDALDLDIDPNNEIELPDDATATAGQILATNVDGTYSWVDDQTGTATIVSTDAQQILTIGTDTGALLTNADIDVTFATDAQLAALSVNDADFDPNNELSDIQLTGTTLQLTNPVTGAIGVDLDPTFVTQTELAAFSGSNLGNSNLTQTANRTYDLNENNLTFDITNSSITFLGTNSNIGVGIPNPQDKLDVDGQIRARNGFAASEGSEINPGYGFYTNGDTNTGMFRIREDFLGFTTFGNEAMRIDDSQNVGIGPNFNITTNTINARLHVDGNILATGTITPDYVFESYFNGKSNLKPSYQMFSLNQIKEFVKLHKHLPGVPSAFEIEEQGGIVVNRATEINLEKIEELFLHTIEQEKKIDELRQTNLRMATEMKLLKAQMAEIKTMLTAKQQN